jgi:hypothetical protein
MPNKKSFILYLDSLEVLEELNDTQVANIFRAIVAFQKGEEYELSRLERIAFLPIQQYMARDRDKYQEYIKRQREYGKMGGRPPKSTDKKREEKGKKGTLSEKRVGKGRKGSKGDNDNDNDNDNVNISNNAPSKGEGKSASASRREDSTNIQPLVEKKTTEESTTSESEEYGNKYVNWLEGFLGDNLKEGCPTAKYRKSVRNVIWNIVQILTKTKTNKHRLPTFKENMLRFWKWYKANRLDQGYQPQYIETVLANVKKYDKLCEKKYNEKHRN